MQTSKGFGYHRPTADGSAREATTTEEPAEPVTLADDAELDLSADQATVRVEETLASLDAELIGLASVKRRVREIASMLRVDRAREQFGLTSSKPTLHMSFTGGPGTGKTTVAMRMATILHALGYIRAPRVHVVTRDDLVGQFIGHTAPKTKEALARAAGGVLFIDEAYYLFRPENERDYGQEVIEILLTEMENERGDLVVIFAGYPDRMATFFSANPGLSSRVPHHIEFEDYSHAELMQIADLMVAEENFRFDDEAREAFSEYLTRRMARPNFSNARSVRNAIERCRLRQARRLVALNRPLGKQDLVIITAEDIRGSSLFVEEPIA
jgi:probable Rubsico expression protein CbbX